MCKNTSTFFIFFTIGLQIFSVFFSRARSTAGEGGQKILALVSALNMAFGSKGWTALFDLVDTLGLKV